jgi:WD40 repeat protein
LLYRLQGHDRDVNAVAFGPDSRLATGSDDTLVMIWPDPMPIDDMKRLGESCRLAPLTPDQRDAAGLPPE